MMVFTLSKMKQNPLRFAWLLYVPQKSTLSWFLRTIYISSCWWILQEVQEILNYQSSGYVTIFPVYYGVDPCYVKRQAVEFTTDQTQTPDTVGTWKALMQLSCFSDEPSDKWYYLHDLTWAHSLFPYLFTCVLDFFLLKEGRLGADTENHK